MHREFICIVCPNSCHISVEYEGTNIKDIKGDQCPKGRDYVKNEITNPLRVFTGSVLVENGDFPLVSVKTSSPIPKQYLKKVGEITRQMKVEAPVELGQIVARNLLNKKIDLIATRKIKKINKKNSLLS
ncbi:MAG TPA: molybdopterin oxidoreductase [Candidatus Atribacteria bacterium]|nr:molybdopterin oxidoreductase [Candidatus Atribacteria bacterium]